MNGTHLKYGIPDIELPRLTGGSVNPACFAGHPLVVVFCPVDRTGEAEALQHHATYASDLASYDAWLITIHRNGDAPAPGRLTASAGDPEDLAWTAFGELAGPAPQLCREEGATFLFGRGGSLERIWRGTGHAPEVLAELAGRGIPADMGNGGCGQVSGAA